ncbi:hypothetical protein KQUDLBSD_CDS0129 [Staphylococcus phage PG-2021_40]
MFKWKTKDTQKMEILYKIKPQIVIKKCNDYQKVSFTPRGLIAI